MKTNLFAWSYVKGYKIDFMLALICAGFAVIFGLILPQITQMFIDSILDYSQTSLQKISPFWFWLLELFTNITFTNLIVLLCIVFVVFAFLKNLFEFLKSQKLYKCGAGATGLMRADCFKKLAHLNNYTQKSETYVHFTNDISDFYDLIVKTYPKIFISILTIVLALILIFFINIKIGFVLILLIPIIFLTGIINLKKMKSNFNDIREKKSKMQDVAENAVNQIREIKIFNREKLIEDRYLEVNTEHINSSLKAFNHYNKTIFWSDLIKAVGMATTLILSAVLCFKGLISVGYFVLLSTYSFTVLNASSQLLLAFLDGTQQLTRIEKVRKFLNLRSEFKDGKQTISSQTPNLFLNKITVVLDGRTIFKNLSAEFLFGKHYAVFLSQGEGKSALAKLLLKFFEPNEGTITIDNIDYQNCDVYSLRKHFSYVSQEPYIFETSFLNNIIMFENLDEKKLQIAIEICGLKKIINKFEGGLDYIFTEKGAELSSQDKQKINLARAIYKNAPILLIDSSFNKFTNNDSAQLITKIFEFYKDRTVIILSDRWVDFEQCEKIFIIENGKLIKRHHSRDFIENKIKENEKSNLDSKSKIINSQIKRMKDKIKSFINKQTNKIDKECVTKKSTKFIVFQCESKKDAKQLKINNIQENKFLNSVYYSKDILNQNKNPNQQSNNQNSLQNISTKQNKEMVLKENPIQINPKEATGENEKGNDVNGIKAEKADCKTKIKKNYWYFQKNNNIIKEFDGLPTNKEQSLSNIFNKNTKFNTLNFNDENSNMSSEFFNQLHLKKLKCKNNNCLKKKNNNNLSVSLNFIKKNNNKKNFKFINVGNEENLINNFDALKNLNLLNVVVGKRSYNFARKLQYMNAIDNAINDGFVWPDTSNIRKNQKTFLFKTYKNAKNFIITINGFEKSRQDKRKEIKKQKDIANDVEDVSNNVVIPNTTNDNIKADKKFNIDNLNFCKKKYKKKSKVSKLKQNLLLKAINNKFTKINNNNLFSGKEKILSKKIIKNIQDYRVLKFFKLTDNAHEYKCLRGKVKNGLNDIIKYYSYFDILLQTERQILSNKKHKYNFICLKEKVNDRKTRIIKNTCLNKSISFAPYQTLNKYPKFKKINLLITNNIDNLIGMCIEKFISSKNLKNDLLKNNIVEDYSEKKLNMKSKIIKKAEKKNDRVVNLLLNEVKNSDLDKISLEQYPVTFDGVSNVLIDVWEQRKYYYCKQRALKLKQEMRKLNMQNNSCDKIIEQEINQDKRDKKDNEKYNTDFSTLNNKKNWRIGNE